MAKAAGTGTEMVATDDGGEMETGCWSETKAETESAKAEASATSHITVIREHIRR